MKNIPIALLIIALFTSCSSGKYSYHFDTGKELDFQNGKWILNKSESNSKIFDSELYLTSKKCFKEILGDSLIEINDLRTTKLIASKVNFDLSAADLKRLKDDTDCDYIINVKGNIISDGAGTVSFQNSNQYYNASNRASVQISIYDLNTGIQISSSEAYGIATDESSHFDDGSSAPKFHASSNTLMLKAAKKLIRQYDKHQL